MTIESLLSINPTSAIADEAVIFPKQNQTKLALADLKNGLKAWRAWLMLAYQDIKLRYRRSIIGPFWITLSMAITVYSMGYLYSHLFHTDLQVYFPFLVAGMLSWSLISTALIEVTEGFTTATGSIKQIKLPYSLYIHRIAIRNIIVFFHNILVIVPIIIIFHKNAKLNLHSLMLFPSLLIMYINTFTWGCIIALICARFRDITQMVKSLVQIIFFLTPVMWDPVILPANIRFYFLLNPFYALVDTIRSPLLGATISNLTLLITALVTIFGCIISFVMFSKYRSKIVYWL